MLINAGKLNIVNLRKSILYDFIDPGQFPLEATGLIFRGIGQKELDFIRSHGYIASKGIGNDADQEATTCFSQLFSQAEGYARTQYDLYNEPQGYVLAVESPLNAMESELGEIEVVGKVPATAIKAVMHIDQLQKAVKKDAPKAITRTQAKSVHKELPPGGEWRTINGHHIYIKDGKVLAGSLPGVTGAKKATKAQLAEHQANIDKEAKKKSPARKTKAQAEAEKNRKAIDELAGQNAKAEAKIKKKSAKEQLAESKKATDEALKKPNPKNKAGKSATKADIALVIEENNKRPKPKGKGATKEDLDKVVEENNKNKRTPKAVTKEDLDEMFGLPPQEEKKPKKGKKAVADVRTEKQENNEVAYDVGKKLIGARKDTAVKHAVDNLTNRGTGQSLEELEKISPELAQKHCVKKNLLSPIDFHEEYKNGTDINVAMAKQLIYDRITPKPAGDTPEDRAQYLNAIRSLQRVLEPIKTWDEFKKAVYSLGDRMKLELPKNIENHAHSIAYAKRKLTEPVTEWDRRKHDYKTGKNYEVTDADVVAERKARVAELEARSKEIVKAKEKPYMQLGEKCLNFFTDYESRNRTFDTIAKKKLDWSKYFTEEEKADSAPKVPKGEKTKLKWERVMPAKIQRTGGRASKVEKPEDMVKNFGFSGVQFGNWIDDTSGNFHMKKCAEAFMDLSDIIGIKDKEVSFNGRLSMAFGARGKGFALAHYEPDSKAINITKEGGAGSLAHEWGHALDNMMYQQSAGYSSLSLASNGMQDNGDPAVKQAYKELMHEILIGKGLGKDMVPNKHKTYYSYHPTFKKAVQELGLDEAIKKGTQIINNEHKSKVDYYNGDVRKRYGDATADKYLQKEERRYRTALNDMVQEMAYHHESITGEKLEEIPAYTGQSQYYIDSSKQAKSSNYWTSNEELFARAFENYIEGKMKSGKVKNDYLVHGTYATIPGFPAPYPQGEERDTIHKAFDKLLAAIKLSGAIQKALDIDLQKGNLGQAIEGEPRYMTMDYLNQHNRNAYNVVDTSEVFFIPVNRLKCPYQTEEALNFDKIRENVERMKSGEALEPVVIGYDYDVHDGHHRIEASKILNYTHIPCIVGGSNELDIQRAKEAYAEVWKSLKDDIIEDIKSEREAIRDYEQTLKDIDDPKVKAIIEEILKDEKNHKHNLRQVMEYLHGDKSALDEYKLKD